MKKFLAFLFACLCLASTVFPQVDKLELIEEFGDVPTSFWFNFLYGIGQQYHKENPRLLIQIQGSFNSNQKLKSYVRSAVLGARMKAHFVGNMKFDAERISVSNCDLESKEIKIKIYKIPENYVPPKCDEQLPPPAETFLFRVFSYENPYQETEDIYTTPGAGEAISEIYDKLLKDLLKNSPNSKILLIGYLGTNYYSENHIDSEGNSKEIEFRKPDKPKVLDQMFKEKRRDLINSGVSAEIISTVAGGYKDSTRSIEIWFIPKNGEIPKLKSDYYPKKK